MKRMMAPLLFGAIIACLSVYRIYLLPGAAGMLSSADELTLPAYYDDLVRGLSDSQGWHFSAAHHYVPDFVVYALFRFVTGDFRQSLALVGVVQPLALFIVGWALYRTVGGRDETTFALLCGTWWLALVTYATWLAPGPFLEFFGYSVALAFHFGPYLTALFGFLLYLWYIRSGRVLLLAGSCLLLVLVTASDLWFMLYFALPALGTAAVLALRAPRGAGRQLTYLFATGAASLGAFFIYQQITPASQNYISSFQISASLDSAGILAGNVWQALWANPFFIGVFVLLPLTLLVGYLGFRTAGLATPPVASQNEAATEPGSLAGHCADARTDLDRLLLFGGLSCLTTAAFTFGFHLYVDAAAIRYFHPLIYTPTLIILIGLGWVLEQRARQHVLLVRRALAIAITGMALSLTAAQPRLAPVEVFPPPDYVACFDHLGASAGLAEYWQAKPLLMYSDRRLQVVAIESQGSAYLWGANAAWYTESWIRPGEPPAYSFILMKGLDPAAISARYGAPDRVVGCADTEIWFYRQPNRLFTRLRESSAELQDPKTPAQSPGSRVGGRDGPNLDDTPLELIHRRVSAL